MVKGSFKTIGQVLLVTLIALQICLPVQAFASFEVGNENTQESNVDNINDEYTEELEEDLYFGSEENCLQNKDLMSDKVESDDSSHVQIAQNNSSDETIEKESITNNKTDLENDNLSIIENSDVSTVSEYVELDISGSTVQEFKQGMQIDLTTYAPQGTQYKFVWEKDNWADWGTIQNFSESSTCTWVPTESGTYNLYVDVKDATGKVQSTNTQVKLTENWNFDSMTVTPTTSNVVGDQATIAVNTSGNNSSLEYKFVWEKDNWADWGTIQNFSESSTCTWTPSQSGTYTLYVDIKDSTGKVTSKTHTYKVGTIGLNVEGSSTQEYKPGMEIKLTTYAPQGTQYKFVWEKDNWADWGTIQNFSESSTCTWVPTESGTYNLYVDVKDATGKVQSTNTQVKLTENWNFDSMTVTPTTSNVVGDQATIAVNTSGNNSSLEYKFVWEKDNWADWGTIQNFSESSTCTWTPSQSGTYTLYVDIKDSTGKVTSKTHTYKVGTIGLNVEGSSTQEYKPGMEIKLTTYAPQGTQYKFVWEKDNWADWGTIQNFSESSTCTWVPTESGTYNLYVDVKDATGKVQSTNTQVKLTENWNFDSMTVTPTTSNVVGDQATIAVNTSGNNSSLEYKFVWEKDNWADWGTIQNFSESSTCTWTPSQSGTYTLYVDIKDSTGKVVSKTYTYDVNRTWSIVGNGLVLNFKQQEVGKSVVINANTAGKNEKLQYKFVWEKDNWADWGTIQNFSESSTCTWTPTEPGDYYLYVDIRDEFGEIVTVDIGYKAWKYLGVNVSISGQNVNISPNMGCTNPEGFSYKYVWERDGWADWGVISAWSNSTSKSFKAAVAGNYSFYVDVKCPDGLIISKNSPKYYIQTDPYYNHIYNYASSTDYLIAVNLADHKVSVYRGSIYNWSLQYRWDCVTGAPSSPTITGAYYTTGFKRPFLSTDSRAIYCTQIWGGYFFHSILASESELGNSLSHGCIRLPYSAALWIYNNIYAGTRVVIW